MKKGFVLYFDTYPQLTALPMEQRGELMTAIFEYAFHAANGELEPREVLTEHVGMMPETRMAFLFLADIVRRDTERWLAKQERYTRAARERAERQRRDGGPSRQAGDAWDYVAEP